MLKHTTTKVADSKFSLQPAQVIDGTYPKLYSCAGCFFSSLNNCLFPIIEREKRNVHPKCLPQFHADCVGRIYVKIETKKEEVE